MTDHQHWDDVMRLFREALSHSADKRTAFLKKACQNEDILSDVQSLLSNYQSLPTGFMESTEHHDAGDPESAAIVKPLAADPLIGRVIGNCTIKSRLAGGGMGRVYVAVRNDFGTKVALKILPPEAATDSAMRRFDLETQTLAKLRHRAIAELYGHGKYEYDGHEVPYFIMEYVTNARPITTYALEKKLGIRERVELFAQVCDAIYIGHQKGVVHRDLKPGNVLVDSSGQPKVIDFGIAKVTDSDKAAVTNRLPIAEIVGTLQYMSPEQFEKDSDDLDSRSDVYALGVLLYELLCERPPYKVDTKLIIEAARIVREEPPPPPSSVSRVLRGDIETITLKALEKDRTRRYRDAAALADDIRNYLNDDPIVARPPSLGYQLSKMAKKRKGAFAAAALVLVSLVTGLSISVRAMAVAKAAQADAEDQAEVASALSGFLTDDLFGAVENFDEPRFKDVLDSASLRVPDHHAEVEASIREAIAFGYRAIDEHGAARPHMEWLDEYERQHVGDDGREAIRAHTRLGLCYLDLGEHAKAIPILEEARQRAVKSLGNGDVVTMTAIATLGLGYIRAQQPNQAEPLLREAVRLREENLGPADLDTCRARQNLAVSLARSDRFDAAIDEYIRVLEVYRKSYGDHHWETVVLESNMAIAYQKVAGTARTTREREAAYKKMLDIYTRITPVAREVLPMENSRLHSILNGYGSSLRANREFVLAERVFMQVFEFYRCRDALERNQAQAAMKYLRAIHRDLNDQEQADYFDSMIIPKR